MTTPPPAEPPDDEHFVCHPLLKSGKIERRQYQDNIFVSVLGQNALVVMPTGLGKTIIAIMLAMERLNARPDSKVVFLAPTKPLAAQHQKTFQEVTTIDPDFLLLFTGSTPPEKRDRMWLDAKIAFMTPQVLQNDIIANRYSLADVSLLIFDEAHRAVGDYAYGFIAEKYLQQATRPQILGITASPGGSKEKIQEVAQNLKITHIEIKTESSPDVRPYVHEIDMEYRRVDLPPEFLKIAALLVEELKKAYKYLKTLGFLETEQVDKVSRKDLLAVRGRVQAVLAKPGINVDLSPYYSAIKNVTAAIRLSHAHELLETQGVAVLDNYFAKCETEVESGQGGASMKAMMANTSVRSARALASELVKKGIVHPKLGALQDIVAGQLEKSPESRVMVFAHFRDSVSLLVEALEKIPGLRPLRFVGQASHGAKDKGLKQKEQIELLTEFKAGTYNVLVATSVAEEGLDVSECDLVVFYDVVPSEIRTIQRRGRTGRRREGRVVVLVARGSRDEGYMWAEKRKEKRMKETLREMKLTPSLSEKKNLQDQRHPGGQVDLFSYAKKPEEDLPPEPEEELPPIPEEAEKSPAEKSEGVEEKVDEEQESSQPSPQHDKESNELTLEIIPGNVSLLIDHRETASAVVKNLSQLGAKISFAALPTGDYVLSSEIAVERKASADFVASIVDGRLFKECAKLTAHYPCPVLILEGQPIGASALHPNAIRGAIASVMVKFHITILQTADAQDTAALVFAIAKKAQEGPKKTIRIRADKGPADLDKVQEFVLAGVPGLNNFRAKSLLSRLGSLERVFTAEEKDLQGAEGIGPKLAKQVRNSATHKYGFEKRLD